MTLTPEQRERLEVLQEKRDKGIKSPTVPLETPVHMTHAHSGGTGGMASCACPTECIHCPIK